MGQQDQTKPQGGMYDKSGQQGSGDLTSATDQAGSGQTSEPRMDQEPASGSQGGTGQSGQSQGGSQGNTQAANQGSAGQMGSSPVTGQETSDQQTAGQDRHGSTGNPR